MIGSLNNAIRLQVDRVLAGKWSTRFGTVTGYNPDTYTVKCLILPEGTPTGDVPIAAVWAGSNFGLFAPPVIGSQVSLTFLGGSLNAAFAECVFFNTATTPLSVPAGELWIVHMSGQFAKFTNDGKLTLSDGHGATAVLNGDGTMTTTASAWTHNGHLTVTGNIDLQGDVTIGGSTNTSSGDFVIDGVNIKTHTHTGVQTGGGTSGPPA